MNLKTTTSCPVCFTEMQLSWETQEIPSFGEALLIAGVCDCGFRYSDTILLSQKEGHLQVNDPDDMDARVIRSSSGTIRVPELSVDVEPGPASESYISNVEGVLARISGIVAFATRTACEAGDAERTSKGEEILENIRLALRGQFSDVRNRGPSRQQRHSLGEGRRSSLTDEEIASLKTGMIILDV